MTRKQELLKLAKKALTKYVSVEDAGLWGDDFYCERNLYLFAEEEAHCLYFCLLAAMEEK